MSYGTVLGFVTSTVPSPSPHPASVSPLSPPSLPPLSPSLPLCLPPSPSVSPYVPSPVFPERIFIWRYRDFTSLGSQSFPPSKPFPSDNVVKICTVSLMFLLHIVCKCSMYLKSMLKSAHKVRPTKTSKIPASSQTGLSAPVCLFVSLCVSVPRLKSSSSPNIG